MKYLKLLLVLPVFIFASVSCTDNPLEGLSDADVIAGLKEALQLGSDEAVGVTNVLDGYYNNPIDASIRILLPDEAQAIYDVASAVPGVSNLLDNLKVELNRAAEEAAIQAKPILVDAITGITIGDGWDILRGADNAATTYLYDGTNSAIHTAFKPDIQTALTNVGAQGTWSDISNVYNPYASSAVGQLLGLEPVNTDLADYTTTKAIDGLFRMVEVKEAKIRDDVSERTTDLLAKVFAEQD